jgi:hypothetical protein
MELLLLFNAWLEFDIVPLERSFEWIQVVLLVSVGVFVHHVEVVIIKKVSPGLFRSTPTFGLKLTALDSHFNELETL